MRGQAFLFDAFFALLFSGILAGLSFPPLPDADNYLSLKEAFRIASSANDRSLLFPQTLSALPGFCFRVTSALQSYSSCEATRWLGVPRTAYIDGRFLLCRVYAGPKP